MHAISRAIVHPWVELNIHNFFKTNQAEYVELIDVSLANKSCIPLEGVMLKQGSKLAALSFNMKAPIMLLIESKAFSHNNICTIRQSINSSGKDI